MAADTADPPFLQSNGGRKGGKRPESSPSFERGGGIVHANWMTALMWGYSPIVAAKAGVRVDNTRQVRVWILLFSS
ncbi:MAG: hypothetical protein ACE5JL_00350 [Dehalococcoidia bacterium]